MNRDFEFIWKVFKGILQNLQGLIWCMTNTNMFFNHWFINLSSYEIGINTLEIPKKTP